MPGRHCSFLLNNIRFLFEHVLSATHFTKAPHFVHSQHLLCMHPATDRQDKAMERGFTKEYESNESLQIATDGLAARAIWFGSTSSATNPLDEQLELLKSTGLTGKQLSERMTAMRADRWQFDAVPATTEVATNNHLKLMTYQYDPASIWAHRVGLRIENPQKVAATYLAHEIMHHDQSVRYPLNSYDYGADIMGKRYVLSEARSYMVEAYTAQSLNVRADRVNEIAAALKRQDLGGLVYDTHNYVNFKDIFRDEAIDIVNEHIENWYHTPPISPQGKLLAFDINRGNNDVIRRLELDDFYRTPADPKDLVWCRKMYRENRSCSYINFEEMRNPLHSRVARWAGKLGMIGTAITVTDLAGAYGRSGEEGDKRLTEFAVDCCGYEAGTAAASRLTETLPLRFRIPLLIMSGIAGSTGARALLQA